MEHTFGAIIFPARKFSPFKSCIFYYKKVNFYNGPSAKTNAYFWFLAVACFFARLPKNLTAGGSGPPRDGGGCLLWGKMFHGLDHLHIKEGLFPTS